MPTLLVNARMNPELAARVEASVTGRKKDPTGRVSPNVVRRIIAWARVVLVIALAVGVYAGVTTYQRAKRELDQKRAELLVAVTNVQSDVTAKDRAAFDRVAPFVTRLSGPYEGDVAAPPGLAAELTRSAVYLRGPIETLRTREAIPGAAAASGKDALLSCLLDPPKTRSESAVLEKVRFARAGGLPFEERTANVRRLNDAIVALPVLSSEFSTRVRTAEDASELAKLRKELEGVPLERGKRALRAELLIAVVDERGAGTAPTELDGERPHDVRVAIVEPDTGRVILRARRHVDPSWIDEKQRPVYAGAADSCALGFDLRNAK
jgi:hypothetical protein